ncbi:chloride channel protein [Flavobacterium sp. N2270]|uniref:chloride channel protein n=1 Tax=Flavobacterium sp. N2270 TaxID=2986831 RepID=UPI0022251FEB|nr:chloride channel protein [Flavobacterium sp. N2270]
MPEKKGSTFFRFITKLFKRLERFIFVLKTMLTPRQFIYLSCILVGISSALAVIFLKTFAHWVYTSAQYLDGYLHLPYSNSLIPVIGIVLTVFVVAKFLDGSIQKGTSHIMYAVAKNGGILPKKQMYSQILTSSLTVGLGGSAGLESPITITGAAFGSNYAQNYRLNYKDRSLLLACGVSSGIAAAFNAPIAGVLFAIEVVLAEISITAFIPIMISAATGALISTILLNEDILLSFKNVKEFDYHNIHFYIVLGLLSGLVSIYYARIFRKLEHFFSNSKLGTYRKALFGASLLAILIFLFPTLFGEGYLSIKTIANNHPEKILENTLLANFKDSKWVLLLFVGITMLAKVFATGLTIGSGGNGGNFAPSLFVGSYLGFVLAYFVNLTGLSKLPVTNFTLVGMAGILSGLFHAPLTAIFLIAEITSGYELMVPLMIVSSVSYALSKRFEPYSFDIKHLADKGEVFTNNKDKNILTTLELSKLVQRDYKSVSNSNNLVELVEVIKTSDEGVFPVLNDKSELEGILYLDNIRNYIFTPFKIKYTTIAEIMEQPKEIVFYDETMETVMIKFEKSGLPFLPVLQKGKLIGIISKQFVLEKYREKLKEMIIE